MKQLIKINGVLLLLIGFFLPIHKKIVVLLFLVWGILSIIGFFFTNRETKPYRNLKFILLLPFFYLIHVLGLIYSNNLGDGLFNLEVKLSMFILPLMLFFTFRNYSENIQKNVIRAFVIGSLAAVLINLTISLYSFSKTGKTDEFIYSGVSHFFHVSYMSLYICLALFFLLRITLNSFSRVSFQTKLLFLFAILLMTVYIILLSSKAGLIGFIFIIIYFGIFVFRKQRLRPTFVWLSIVTMIILFFGIIKFSPMNERFRIMLWSLENRQFAYENQYDGTMERMLVWQTSMELGLDNFVAGVGTGDVKDELIKKYLSKNMGLTAEKQLNSHSQYLETFVAFGIIGLLMLLIVLFYPLIALRKNNNHEFNAFIILFILNIFVESMFETQAGVVFFSFFYSLFMVGNGEKLIKNT